MADSKKNSSMMDAELLPVWRMSHAMPCGKAIKVDLDFIEITKRNEYEQMVAHAWAPA